jgi:hypothetical protein
MEIKQWLHLEMIPYTYFAPNFQNQINPHHAFVSSQDQNKPPLSIFVKFVV